MVFYDHKPKKVEPVGDGRYRYRWNIKESPAQAMPAASEEGEAETPTPQWQAEEVIVPRLQSNVITAAVIAQKWDASYEQKLVNDYNAAQLDVYGEAEAQAKTQAYTDFLNARNALKAQVDADCKELGIM